MEDVKAQNTFLAQRSKAQSLLASAKTEEEYFKVMQQLLASRSEPSIASSSDESDDAESFISLGDDNEDDCFGILPPIKMLYRGQDPETIIFVIISEGNERLIFILLFV